MNIGPAEIHEKSEWLRMRRALWPDADPQELGDELDAWLAREDAVVLVARRENASALCGFAEVGTRSVADGCASSPVAYLEGWYVDEDMRGQGIGAALVRAAEQWAKAQGHVELASDAQLSNLASQRAHAALGFVEVERAVLYRKPL